MTTSSTSSSTTNDAPTPIQPLDPDSPRGRQAPTDLLDVLAEVRLRLANEDQQAAAEPEPSQCKGCGQTPPCPAADAKDAAAAHVIVQHDGEQGWSLLCNGLLLFTDLGALLTDGRVAVPCRLPAPHRCELPPGPA